ncbi:MAG: hypothetical protein ACN4GW_15620 [Desulforhopalus sp.]
MDNLQGEMRVVSSSDLHRHSRHIAETFLQKSADSVAKKIDLFIYPDQAAYNQEARCIAAGPICCERYRDAVRLHICSEGLDNITTTALQGWIEHELAIWFLRHERASEDLNFKRQIFPLMPVTGLAQNHMQELVNSLEIGLCKYLATQSLVEMDSGTHQVHFLFFNLKTHGDSANYQSVIEHSWSKALFLCNKLRELMPIACLAERDVDFARELHSLWWKTHGFLKTPDQKFLQELVNIPQNQYRKPFDHLVVDMFKTLRDSYLDPQQALHTDTFPPTRH